MTIKEPSRKWIIIPISTNNIKRVIASSNMNRLLKDIKSEILINFIWSDNKNIIITTNQVATTSDLNIIEKYIKDLNNINSSVIKSLRLSQSKSYLKILDISYFEENTNFLITADIVERVIQTTHLFNNVILAFCSHIIKVSPKLDMAIV